MKKTLIYILIFVLSIGIVYSAADEFTEAKKIVDAKTPCSKLTENQLEMIGDYYMEQMHPGEAHTTMDKMMGGEGSESLRLMHIAIAKRIYCNEMNSSIDYGYRGMMGSSYGQGMMGNFQNDYGSRMQMMGSGVFGYGMMGNYGYWGFYNFLMVVLFVGLIILVYLWIIKVWKDIFRKKNKVIKEKA